MLNAHPSVRCHCLLLTMELMPATCSQHKRYHVKNHPCPDPKCQRRTPPISFGTPRDLERHQRTHARRRQRTQCPYCLRTVGRSDNLKRHIKAAHPNEYPGSEESGSDDETVGVLASLHNGAIAVNADTMPSNETWSPLDPSGSGSSSSGGESSEVGEAFRCHENEDRIKEWQETGGLNDQTSLFLSFLLNAPDFLSFLQLRR